MLSASALLKATPQLRLATRQMTVISGPPRVRISLAEKAVHGLIIAGAVFILPGYVLANIKNYKARD